MASNLCTSFSCIPALGGSVIITSGLPCVSKKVSSHILITSPAKKAVAKKAVAKKAPAKKKAVAKKAPAKKKAVAKKKAPAKAKK